MKKSKILLIALSLALSVAMTGCTVFSHHGKGNGPHKVKVKSNKGNSKIMIK